MGLEKREQDHSCIEFLIEGKEIGYYCIKFEWTCFVNSGHRVTASFKDTFEDILDEQMIKDLLLKSKRPEGINAEVRIWQHYTRKKGKKTIKRSLKILTLNSYFVGGLTEATLEVVCIDKASWLLNRGKCDGDAYQGSIGGGGGVISQVVNRYAPTIKAEVHKTNDSKKNWWWEMRLDPKTLISSMVEWSASITPSATPFVIHCQDDEFKCREWNKLPPTKTNGKKFYIASKENDIKEWTNTGELQVLSNHLLPPVATRLYTGSISATTGLYVDKKNAQITDKQKYANDKLTGNKLGPKPLRSDQSYKQYDSEHSTFIEPVPEHNNGDIGIKYQDYSIGRARDWYMRTIYTSMRVKVTIEPGDTDFDDVYACGRDRIDLEIFNLEKKPYYLNGIWMLYGFRHLLDLRHWKTELLLCRLDHNAKRVPI